MSKPMILNILAQRYTSRAMCDIWTEEGKIRLERELWIAVMRGQKSLGVDIPDGVIEAYEEVIDIIDLESIAARERVTKHDVKARLDEFSELAGHQHAHMGMTSRDLTDNVEQMQILRSLQLISQRVVAALIRLGRLAKEHERLVLAGRSHNVAGQPITLGKRFATTANELMVHLESLDQLIETYPLRGLKGAMGTSQDQLDLLDSAQDLWLLESIVEEHLGFFTTFGAVGQVYPRSLDLAILSMLHELACAPSSLATTIRLMAGQELITEGFQPGQVGSTGMPHKMNSRTCERICGFKAILSGYPTMIGAVAGNQWNEGDVSCSVVRRVALPDAFFAIDGLFEAFITVLDDLGAYPAIIERELERYLPFLTTTAVLMACTKKGMGREDAHAAIKTHATAVALEMRNEGLVDNDLFVRLAADPAIPLDARELDLIIDDPLTLTGNAVAQVEGVCSRIDAIAGSFPGADEYVPEPIL